jgi:hypothetical protein
MIKAMRKWAVAGLLATAGVAAWWFVYGPSQEPVTHESLLAIACDANQGQDARGEAVFRLFSDHVPANADATTVRQVFADCDWIAESTIFELDFQSGQGHPLWVKQAGTLFRLDLFTLGGPSDWIVYVRLSGSQHSATEVRQFFSPRAASDPGMRLQEFALWNARTGKQEVFNATGRHLQPADD